MIQHKMTEIYLFIIVFVASIILFMAFFILTSQNNQTEQTYQMTDHSLKNTEQTVPHHNDEQSMFAITLSK
ncbi:hypothetical protein TP70_11270 [Staphylococcus microti]|uniref:Uncharacterized protein n=1 Tax=Staphylococcus microti TaxID=569857 RepID=A0A0D6XPI9_9STAP|nr:DNA damage-induced cell division inhibitor SosA [Staphylococcus microti]KIX89733.1 hypothetical protein TP70_11270 [Staphylococcus microti]PNZ83490.1 hypothetical protein CD132_02270 [Staphylococcus microti]SUM57717.1 Uncharacterised protein [Staphylococcus microti]